jgi:hypothetical protein
MWEHRELIKELEAVVSIEAVDIAVVFIVIYVVLIGVAALYHICKWLNSGG